ncbi:Structural polyprotein [Clarias magur]|uniref:Structural polyprotein n=1 Tax=Clarias magur TaxID=1594786 RepID=A0A8J4X8J0_CLAMG|nr:Structural polyprotein [Clarias magur]
MEDWGEYQTQLCLICTNPTCYSAYGVKKSKDWRFGITHADRKKRETRVTPEQQRRWIAPRLRVFMAVANGAFSWNTSHAHRLNG